MNSKFILISLTLIFFTLFLIGGVSAKDNATMLSDNNLDNDVLNLELNQNYTPDSINKGQLFDLYLSVKNTGSDPYHNLTILYNLPKGLELVLWPEEYYNKLAWNIDTLYPGETNTLTLVCLPMYSNYTYEFTASIEPKLDTMEVQTNPLADLSVSVDYIVENGFIKWIVKVINNGPDYATNSVANNLPTDLGIISYNLTKGSLYNNQWLIGDLASGEAQTLILITNFADGYKYDISVMSDTVSEDLSNHTVSGIVKLNDSKRDIPAFEEILNSKATANPIVLLLLAVIFVPGLRFKKD